MAQKKLLAWITVALVVLAACGPAAIATPTATPGPTPTPVARATPTPPSPVATPTPVATPSPTPPPAVDKYGGTFRVALTRGDEPWDITTMPRGGVAARVIVGIAFNNLFVVPNTPRTGCSLVRQLDVAQAWKWRDDTTMELKIHEGIRFHNKAPVNGREMTAADVVFSLSRLKAVQARIAGATRHITGVEALDRYNLRISLGQPYPSLIEDVLATPFGGLMLAKEAGDFSRDPQWGSWAEPAKSHIGSGPFMFVQEFPGVKATYRKHPDYWKKGQPYLDQVEFHIMPEWSTQMAALAAGKIDGWPWQTPLEIYLTVKKTQPQANISQGCPNWGNPVLYFNTQKPPFNDVRLRRAVSMAVNRKGIVDLMEGQAVPVAALPPSYPFILKAEGLPPEVRRFLEYRPEEARKLLAEAGFPTGFETTMHISTTALPRLWTVYAEAVVPYLEAAGVKPKIKNYERGAWDAVANKGQYEGMAMITGAVHEPTLWLSTFHSKNDPSMNRSVVADPRMDALVEELNRTLDQAKWEDLAKQIQVRMVDQAYWVYLPAQTDWAISQPWVRDFGPMAWGTFSSTWAEIVWIDRTKKR